MSDDRQQSLIVFCDLSKTLTIPMKSTVIGFEVAVIQQFTFVYDTEKLKEMQQNKI